MSSPKYLNNTRSSRQSNKFARDKSRRTAWTIGLVIISIITWVSALSNLGSLGLLKIDRIEITGAGSDISGALQAAAMNAMEGSHFGIFSKDNALFYPHSAVSAAVLAASERVSRVSVKRNGLNALTISVEEKSPAALICANLPDWNNGSLAFDQSDDCYFADASGLVYERAPSFSGHVYNRYYMPDLGDATSSSGGIIGLSALPTSEFQSIQKLYDTTRSDRLDIQAMLIHSDGEYEMYVSDTVIYFNNHTSLDDQLSNLISFWSSMMSKSRAKGENLQFDSIDVRYGSNVFYRLNNH